MHGPHEHGLSTERRSATKELPKYASNHAPKSARPLCALRPCRLGAPRCGKRAGGEIPCPTNRSVPFMTLLLPIPPQRLMAPHPRNMAGAWHGAGRGHELTRGTFLDSSWLCLQGSLRRCRHIPRRRCCSRQLAGCGMASHDPGQRQVLMSTRAWKLVDQKNPLRGPPRSPAPPSFLYKVTLDSPVFSFVSHSTVLCCRRLCADATR